MWQRGRQSIEELRRSKPGERFRGFYQRHGDTRGHNRVARTLYMALGWIFTVAGIVLMVLPVVPGFFLIFPGLALIAVHSRWTAEALDRLECRLRSVVMRVRKRRA